MNKRSEELLQMANEFIGESEINIICANVGGSVGRGEADEFSDVDLTVYTDAHIHLKSSNFVYKGEVIQLEILHTDELPDKQDVIDSPWDYRYLVEGVIVKDRNGMLGNTKEWVADYFHTDIGKKKIINQVSKIVSELKTYALNFLKLQKYYSATNAAMGAWAEAGFLYLFINHHSLSTGDLIPEIQKLEWHFRKLKSISPFSNQGEVFDIPLILSSFRTYLRNQGYSNEFVLNEIQDTLCERKIQRLLNKKEYFNLQWQMYGEAFWLYLETANGVPFEKYFERLPNELQKGLNRLGFLPLRDDGVKEICRLSDELLTLSYWYWKQTGWY